MTVMILIRRVVKMDKEKEFLQGYIDQRPFGKEGFITEYLTKVEDVSLPALDGIGLLA